MDKGVKHPSSRQAAVSNEWEPVEPDPEQLTQERVQQQQLQIHIGYHDQYKYKRAQNENTDSLEKSDDEDETEDLPVYDSLEVLPIAKRNVNLLQTEYLDTHINQREETRYVALFLFYASVYATTAPLDHGLGALAPHVKITVEKPECDG